MKATLSNGTVLEGEAHEIAKTLRQLSDGIPSGLVTAAVSPSGTGTDTQVVWTEKSVRSFWAWLYGDQKKLMEFLFKKKGGEPIEEIKSHLGLKTGNQLAGVLSCITRNARRETGYAGAMAYGYEKRDGDWYYFVRPEVAEVIKKIASD